MDGYEATKIIRVHEEAANKHTNIIAMTANVMKGDKETCFAVGMDDYISKPIQPLVLTEKLEEWLDVEFENKIFDRK